jgi:hypothetical protein
MPKVKLTTKTVENAKVQPGERLELFDATLPGFGLRVGSTNKTWFIFYRFGGKQKRLNLGHFPALSLSDARTAAGKALESVDAGSGAHHGAPVVWSGVDPPNNLSAIAATRRQFENLLLLAISNASTVRLA